MVSWLRELVEIPVGVNELADSLTLRGFEVGSIERWHGNDGNTEDAVLDLEITTNRPDCLSVLGIAREVGTIYNTNLQLPVGRPATNTDDSTPLTVSVDDPHLCPRYVGAVAGVSVQQSPQWLIRRLEAADIRPINNVVDITNYVMLELGHPMHAFDLGKLASPTIRVRRAHKGETLRTLDGIERHLQPEMLAIADDERACAVAGVMGGADSEVTETTQAVVLEAAYFNAISIRRTSKILGLATDASYRFERGSDIDAPAAAAGDGCPVARKQMAHPARPDHGPEKLRPVRPRADSPVRPAELSPERRSDGGNRRLSLQPGARRPGQRHARKHAAAPSVVAGRGRADHSPRFSEPQALCPPH